MKIVLPVCLSLLCLLPTLASGARIWRDVTGKYSIEAEFVAIEGDVVQLERSDGKVISVPLSKLRPSDREYAKSQAESAMPQPAPKDQAEIAPQPHTYEVNTRRSTSFSVDRDGNKTKSEIIRVQLQLIGSQAAKAVAFGELQIDEASSSGGAVTQVREFGRPMNKKDHGKFEKIERGANRCLIPIYLKAGPECKVIDKLSGSVKLRVVEGADLIRIDDFKTRMIDDPTLKKKGIRPKLEVVHVSAGGAVAKVVRLTFTKKPESVFARVLDDKGEGEGNRGSYTQGSQYTMQWTFQGESLPPEVVLEFTCKELPTVQIPFTVEGIQVK